MSGMRDVMAAAEGRSPEEVIQRALWAVRHHLGMEVAYLSEFVDEDIVFRAVVPPASRR